MLYFTARICLTAQQPRPGGFTISAMNPTPHPQGSQRCGLDALGQFDEIVDVRTPAEYEDDHIPGALNAPVLSNEERVLIGTMYAQESPFKATRLGAALVARHIAEYLETIFADQIGRAHV